jgi:molybdopterin synthase catalytic subunit/molybdopterin synthase sulfur carrier subunit
LEGISLRVRVLAFARVREIVGSSQSERVLGAACTLGELWAQLVSEMPALAAFSSSIRFARNGQIVEPGTPLGEGDEVALLPPVSGG